MRAVLQRVSHAVVRVDGELVSQVGEGLLVLVGVAPTDTVGDAEVLAAKVSAVRIFPDDDGRMNRSVIDVGGSVMVVSQFTLLGDVRRGRRPSFTGAADPAHAVPVLEALVAALEGHDLPVVTGRFGALMDVESTNHGPVTLVIDVADGRVAQLPT